MFVPRCLFYVFRSRRRTLKILRYVCIRCAVTERWTLMLRPIPEQPTLVRVRHPEFRQAVRTLRHLSHAHVEFSHAAV